MSGKDNFVYVANLNSESISQYAENPVDGILTSLVPSSVPSGYTNPAYLAINEKNGSLYVYVTCNTGNDSSGRISVFKIGAKGKLKLQEVIVETGNNPTGIAVLQLATTSYIYATDGDSSNLHAYEILGTGDLNEKPTYTISTSPNARMLKISKIGDTNYAYIACLDAINVFSINDTGNMTQIEGSPYVFPSWKCIIFDCYR